MVTSLKTLIDIVSGGFNRFFNNTTNNFIVNSSTPSPIGVKYYKLEVLSAVEGLELVDSSLSQNSGGYPTTLNEGVVSYGAFKNVKLTNGIIKLYI